MDLLRKINDSLEDLSKSEIPDNIIQLPTVEKSEIVTVDDRPSLPITNPRTPTALLSQGIPLISDGVTASTASNPAPKIGDIQEFDATENVVATIDIILKDDNPTEDETQAIAAALYDIAERYVPRNGKYWDTQLLREAVKGNILQQLIKSSKYRVLTHHKGELMKVLHYLIPVPDATDYEPASNKSRFHKVSEIQDNQVVESNYYFNSYIPPSLETVEGDVTPFIEHMERITSSKGITRPEVQHWLTQWLAHMIQHPEQKAVHAVLLYGTRQGTGKSTLAKIMENVLVGNVKSIRKQDIVNKFNGFQENSIFAYIDDANDLSKQESTTIYEEFKSCITKTDNAPLELKGQDIRYIKPYARYMMISNDPAPLPFAKNERRWFAVKVDYDKAFNDEELDTLLSTFYNWLDNKGYNKIYSYLLNYDLKGYVFTRRPPVTTELQELIDFSDDETGLKEWLGEANVCLAVTVTELLKRTGNSQRVKPLMSELGFKYVKENTGAYYVKEELVGEYKGKANYGKRRAETPAIPLS